MTLSVVTLTRGDRPEWLAESIASVRLPQAGDKHLVLQCSESTFQATRWETTKMASGYVAWVDDDDRVVGDALARCVAALEATGAGIAFTHEARIDDAGARIPGPLQRPVSRRDVAMHPGRLHHLAVVRASCLDEVVLQHALRIGIGIDWLMRAYAALVHGAVQVPVVGYEWRMHDAQHSRTAGWDRAYASAMERLRSVTTQWMGLDEKFPLFTASP